MTQKQHLCVKATVSGKVQNVWFRDNTKTQATQLKLTGWVRNNEDGTVELVACGRRDHVMELTEWLWQGSPASEVSNVTWEEITCEQTFRDFMVI